MDPMDYTMDDSHPSRQQNNNASRCPYVPPQLPSLNFGSHSRENQHYDPVHDTNSWHTSSSSNLPNRPNFTLPQNPPQWQSSPYAPVHSWDFGEFHPGNQPYHSDVYGQRARSGPVGGLSNSAWNGGFEPMSFGYSASQTELGNTTNNNAISNQNSSRENSRLNGWNSSAAARQRLTMEQLNNRSQPSRTDVPPLLHDHTAGQRMGVSVTVTESTPARPSQPPSEPRISSSAARITRYHSTRMNNHWMDGPARIRRGLDISDDDEDSDLERESNEIYRREEELSRRENELARREDGNEERAMAVLRGAIALGKRVPSKAAIASLQVVKVEDLKEADKTCIICYNEFGAANPEGLVEQPLRLPKCKHVFGDTCIKKWFEDSDTCPYCRDKLPAELSMSRGAALESLRAQRERLAAAMQYRRAQAGGGPRFPFLPEGTLESREANADLLLRRAEEYDLAHRTSLEHSSSVRSTSGDFSENRRRQTRGRNGSNRAGHALRPMSVGSARFVGSMMTQQSSPQRAQVPPLSEWATLSTNSRPGSNMSPEHRAYVQRERDAFVAAMTRTRQTGGETAPQVNPLQTPPRNRPSSSFSSPSEQPSPPVVIGSSEMIPNRRSQESDYGQHDETPDLMNDTWGTGPLFTNSGRAASPTPQSSAPTRNISADAPPFHPMNSDANAGNQLYGASGEYLLRQNMNGMGGAAQPRWSQ